MTVKIIVNGIRGKMGTVTAQAINKESDLMIVAGTNRNDNLSETIKKTGADIVIDFTGPDVVFANSETIIAAGAKPIIGTSGLTLDQIQHLESQCKDKQIGGIIAPNFSLSAILMMRFASQAARYFNDVEVIEMHHPHKVDSPSGTATKTAQMISANRKGRSVNKDNAPARGDQSHEVPIHSVRLPGLFAHQTVMFGGTGEILTIRQDSMDRSCMMPGIVMACRKVMALDHLVYGLENLLD